MSRRKTAPDLRPRCFLAVPVSSGRFDASDLSELRCPAGGRLVRRARRKKVDLLVVLPICALMALTACGEAPIAPLEKRTIEDRERGCHFVVPPRWSYLGEEVRSPGGTIFTIEVLSLVDADPGFLAKLPRSLVPQLEARTRYFFSVVDKSIEKEETVGGEPALEVRFSVHIRAKDPPSEVIYWVVPRGQRLYALRATYPPGLAAADAPAVAQILESWKFI